MKLHWPEVKLPEYRPGRYGRWTLDKTHGRMPGYFTPELREMNAPALKRKEHGKDIVWMSLAYMEQESHMPHIAAAHGHTVVMGLGMGMYLYNIIQKPEVKRVTVIERDESVYKLLRQISDYDQWPGIEKVEVIFHDAKTWKTTEHVDFLYADFWKRLADDNALRWTQEALRNVNPMQFGYWTQEFDFMDWIRANQVKINRIDSEWFDLFAESVTGTKTGPMMVGQGDDRYAVLSACAVVVQSIVSKRESPFEAYMLQETLERLLNKYLSLANK